MQDLIFDVFERILRIDMHSLAISKKAKIISWLCTLVYFGSYMTRKNFNAMMLYVIRDFGEATGLIADDLKVQLAVILTGMTISYGIGQVVCGFIGDKIKAQYMLTGGLALAATTNILMAVPGVASIDNIVLMVVLWSVNGVAHSMLWPPMVRIMSMYLNDEEYSYAAVRVSWGSQFATILLFIMCPLLCDTSFIGLNWRWVMLICAAMGVAICACWTVSAPKLLVNPIHADLSKKKGSKAKSGVPLPSFVILPLVLIFMGIIFQGVMRDGIEQWAPTLIKESFGLGEFASTLSAVILAVFGILSFAAYDFIHRKLFKNEVFCSAMIFVFSAVIASAVLMLFVFQINSAFLSILLMAVIVANMHGINLMLITVVPKRFVKSGKVSLFSGVLNACTYIGSSVGTIVFAWLSTLKFENLPPQFSGWTPVVFSWIIVSLFGCAVLFICAPMWKRFRREYSENDDLVLEETAPAVESENNSEDSIESVSETKN